MLFLIEPSFLSEEKTLHGQDKHCSPIWAACLGSSWTCWKPRMPSSLIVCHGLMPTETPHMHDSSDSGVPFGCYIFPNRSVSPSFSVPQSSYTTLELTVEAASVEKRLVLQPLLTPILGAHSPTPAQQGGSSANSPQSSFLIYPNKCFQFRVERRFSESLFEF